MCGITGFWQLEPFDRDRAGARVAAMAKAIRHRGPDDSGVWIDEEGRIALGHRRLSIVDLSPEGRQPMVSRSGRYVLVFNGEVYNYRRIRDELAGEASFRSNSDTEVMLAAIERWGLTEATRRFIGMFAFAVWDKHQRELALVRDRLGIKPLYYTPTARSLVFGSELRALTQYPIDRALNGEAISGLLSYGVIPAPLSVYRGTFKQLPGTILRFRETDLSRPTTEMYWSAVAVAREGLAQPFTGSDEAAVAELESLLRDAVGLRMIADVPLGAFLSGGIDSSTIVALMQSQATQRVRTFSIGFREAEFNESLNARAVARHLGTEHTELVVGAREALEVVPKLPEIYDEPFADSSQVPTFLVSSLTRRHVTVALSGDGGDELFGGYNRHVWIPLVWSVARRIPAALRSRIGATLESATPGLFDRLYSSSERFLPERLRIRIPGEKLVKLGAAFRCASEIDMYERVKVHWTSSELSLLEKAQSTLRHPQARLNDARASMMLRDLEDYLPNDILTKVDRASMAVGLEARVPLLDHRVVAFSWRLPGRLKVRGTQGKWILRRLLARYLPEALFDRPKMGFGVPLAAWLRGPLREWGETLLAERRLRQDGLLNPSMVRAAWSEHVSGRRDRHHELWILLMLNAWLDFERGSPERFWAP